MRGLAQEPRPTVVGDEEEPWLAALDSKSSDPFDVVARIRWIGNQSVIFWRLATLPNFIAVLSLVVHLLKGALPLLFPFSISPFRMICVLARQGNLG